FDLFDSSLAPDLQSRGSLDASIHGRIDALARYAAESSGAAGSTSAILFSCSAFGPAIDQTKARLSIPVLRPNEAAFEKALAAGDRIGLLVTFMPSLASLERELHEMAAAAGRQISVTSMHVEGALAALKAGNVEE